MQIIRKIKAKHPERCFQNLFMVQLPLQEYCENSFCSVLATCCISYLIFIFTDRLLTDHPEFLVERSDVRRLHRGDKIYKPVLVQEYMNHCYGSDQWSITSIGLL